MIDTSVITAAVLLGQFNSSKTRNAIRKVAEENNGYVSLLSVLDPVVNRVPDSPEDAQDQAFDEVILELLRRTCRNLMFICKDFMKLHNVTTNSDGTPSNENYSMIVSNLTGKIMFYGRGGRYTSATLDVTECLSKIPLHGFPVDWI
jgi:hypothetical protein